MYVLGLEGTFSAMPCCPIRDLIISSHYQFITNVENIDWVYDWVFDWDSTEFFDQLFDQLFDWVFEQ